MRRWVVLLIGTFIGVASFFIMPGAFKFLGFFFSIFSFAIAVRATNQRFNFHIILICMIIFLFFGSSLLTFDASTPLNTESMISYVTKGLNTLIIALAFGVPIMLILGGIWAIIIGQIMSGIKALFYALVMIAFILAFAFISELVGLEDFGISDWILDFYTDLTSFMFELPISVYEGVDSGLGQLGWGLDLPDIPENKHFRQPEKQTTGFTTGNGMLDGLLNGGMGYGNSMFGGIQMGNVGLAGGGGGGGNSGTNIIGSISNTVSNSSRVSLPTLSALTYEETVAGVHDSLPLIAGLMNLISIPFFAFRRSEEIIIAYINKFQVKSRREIPRKRQIGKRTTKADPVMISFIVAIIISAWFIFLAYTNAYGENAREDWRYTIFIYYVLVVALSCFLLIWVFRTYTPVTTWSFIKGNVYGLFGLFLLARLFMSHATFNAFSSIEMHSNGWYAVNTFIFIAPAETICFCVMLPCFFLWILMRSERKQTEADKYMNLDRKISKADLWIVAQQIKIEQKQKDIDDANTRKEFFESLHGTLYRKTTHTTTHLEPLKTKEREAKEADRIIKLRKEKQQLAKDLNKLKYAKTRLVKQQQEIEVPLPTIQRDNMLANNRKKAFIFAVGILISAFAFSSLHWAIISTEISYAMYWLVGMAVINFCAGCWMAVIAWRYDWFSATTSHAFFNVSTILMVILSAGI